MSAVLLLVFKITLLAILWVTVLLALRAMREDLKAAAGPQAGGGTLAPVGAVRATPNGGRRQVAARLLVVEGPLNGSHLAVSTLSEVVMGRSPECDFQLGDDYASARHARLFRRGSEWFVEDLDSRNGTFVGGYRIDQPERVEVGTDVKVGRTTVRLVP